MQRNKQHFSHVFRKREKHTENIPTSFNTEANNTTTKARTKTQVR